MKKLLLFFIPFLFQIFPQDKPELIIPVGHQGRITTIKISPDGKYILSGCNDQTVKLWERSTGQLLRTLSDFGSAIGEISFSPNGTHFYTIEAGGLTVLRETATGKIVARISNGSVGGAAWSPDGKELRVSTSDGYAAWYETDTGKRIKILKDDLMVAMSYAFSPDGKYVAATAWNGTVNFFDSFTGKRICSSPSGGGSPVSSGFSNNSKYFFVADHEGSVKLYTFNPSNLIAVVQGTVGPFNKARFSPDSKLLATWNSDDSIFVRDSETGKILYAVSLLGSNLQPWSLIDDIVFTADSKSLLIIFWSSYPVLWNPEKGEIKMFEAFGSSADIDKDGKSIVIGGVEGGIFLSDTDCKTKASFTGSSSFLGTVNFDSTGSLLLVSDDSGIARVIDMSTGERRVSRIIRNWFSDLSQNGKLAVFTGYRDPTNAVPDLFLWYWEESEKSSTISLNGFSLSNWGYPVFSSGGDRVAVYSMDSLIRIVDLGTGKTLLDIYSHGKGINSVAFSRDGSLLAVANHDGTAAIYESHSGKELVTFKSKEFTVLNDVVFSSDNKSIITVGTDGSIRVWEIAGKKLNRTIKTEEWVLGKVFMSPDGKTIVTSNNHDNMTIFNFENGQLLRRIRANHYNSDVNFPRNLVAVTDNSFLRFFDLTDGTELVSLCFIDSTEWCAVHPSGLFDASPGAMEKMYYVQGLDIIQFNQLKDKYWEPGLFSKVMNHETLRDVEAIDKKLDLWPEITDLLFRENYQKLEVSLRNQGGGIGKIQVFLNGKEMYHDAGKNKIKPGDSTAKIIIPLKDHPFLINGENKVEVMTWNSQGTLSSKRESAEFIVEKEQGPPEIFIVAIGVSDYSGDKIDLKFASKDAADFLTAAKLAANNLFSTEHTSTYLLNTDNGNKLQPTKAAIVATFNEISKKADPGDVVVVYLSGHGLNIGGENGDLHFLTKDAFSPNPDIYKDAAVKEKCTISGAELVTLLNAIPASKQVLIIDACSAGKLVENLAVKRDIESSIIKALERMKDRTGLHIITGCAADAVSYEASKFGQGLLTYSLLAGMRGLALRDNKMVDIALLMQHAREMVPKLAEGIGGIQEPRIFSPKGAESFDIGIVTDAEKPLIPLAKEKPIFISTNLQDANEFSDVLGLSDLVDEQLTKLSEAGNDTKLVFWAVKSYPEAYRISGSYTQKGENVEVRFKLIKDKSGSETKIISGSRNKLNALIDEIIRSAFAYL